MGIKPIRLARLDALMTARRACADVIAQFEFCPLRTDDDAVILANCENAIDRIDAELARREQLADLLLEGALI